MANNLSTFLAKELVGEIMNSGFSRFFIDKYIANIEFGIKC